MTNLTEVTATFDQLKTCPVDGVELEKPAGCYFVKMCPNNHGMFSLAFSNPRWYIKFS